MHYHIQHTTEYHYDEVIGFTPQLIRLFPRMDDRIRMSEYKLTVFPEGSIYWLRDPYDNAIAKFFSTEQSKQLSVTIEAVIEHRQESAFDFLLDSHAIKFPFEYTEKERDILSPYLSQPMNNTLITSWLNNATAVTLEGDTTTCLTSLLTHIHQSIHYQRRDEPGIQPPEETLRSASGTCRDYAVLFMAVCSHFGLATRFVSGYLYASDEGDTLGADSLHAWTDVYLPGAGWRGLDPTNGIWCGNCHIPLAVSKNPDDTTPIEGNYCADHPVSSKMKTHLHIQNPSCIDENK